MKINMDVDKYITIFCELRKARSFANKKLALALSNKTKRYEKASAFQPNAKMLRRYRKGFKALALLHFSAPSVELLPTTIT